MWKITDIDGLVSFMNRFDDYTWAFLEGGGRSTPHIFDRGGGQTRLSFSPPPHFLRLYVCRISLRFSFPKSKKLQFQTNVSLSTGCGTFINQISDVDGIKIGLYIPIMVMPLDSIEKWVILVRVKKSIYWFLVYQIWSFKILPKNCAMFLYTDFH